MSQRDEVTILMAQCGVLRKALTEISNSCISGDLELSKAIAITGLVEADAIRLHHGVQQPLASSKPQLYSVPIAS